MVKPIVDIFANWTKQGTELVWSVHGRGEFKPHINQQFRSREEAFAFVEGLSQGFKIGQQQ